MNAFDLSVKRFDEFASEFADRFMNIDAYRSHFEQFCDMLESQQPAILELGCGPGNVTRFLKQRFPESAMMAIDLAPRMIEIARQTVEGVNFQVMDVRHIRSLDGQFDGIMCAFCLPFLSQEDTGQLIADCSDKLKDNGILYISTMEGDASKAGFESTSFSGDAQVYFNYHTGEDLEKLLIANGFSLVQLVRQDYHEPDGSVLTDLILIARKRSMDCNDV